MVPHGASLVALALLGGGVATAARQGLLAVDRRWLAVLVLLGAASFAGPLDRLGEERSLSVHVVQHMLLFSALPVLVLRALAPRRWIPRVTGARAAWLLGAGVLVVWLAHTPPVMDASVERPAVNDASHIVLLAAGLAMAWPLMAAVPLGGMAAVAYVAVAEVAVGVLGMWLTWYQTVVYDAYATLEPLWGLDVKTDQSLAGALLLVVEEPFLAVEVVVLLMAVMRDDDEDDDQGSP